MATAGVYTWCGPLSMPRPYTPAMNPLPPWLRSSLQGGGGDLEILVVRMGAMGDILRTLPAVRLLRAALPEAGIVWVCDAGWAPLLQGHPDLAHAISRKMLERREELEVRKQEEIEHEERTLITRVKEFFGLSA